MGGKRTQKQKPYLASLCGKVKIIEDSADLFNDNTRQESDESSSLGDLMLDEDECLQRVSVVNPVRASTS